MNFLVDAQLYRVDANDPDYPRVTVLPVPGVQAVRPNKPIHPTPLCVRKNGGILATDFVLTPVLIYKAARLMGRALDGGQSLTLTDCLTIHPRLG